MTTLPKFGPFRLRRPIGRGGMAMVWRAVHERHDHPVAIKIMTGQRARKQRFVDAFQREVRAVARMNHPGIVRVFDYGEIHDDVARAAEGHLVAGSPYMVMELAESTLARIDHDRLTWPHVHTILAQILDGLAHAHARGLVHRDLKPDNVLFLPGEDRADLKLSDFGVAYAMDADHELRADDEIVTGTPRYMAPEQIEKRLRDQGPWTDLYALGCLAYWLTSGQPPFSEGTVDELLRRHLTEERPSLHPRIGVPDGFAEWARRLVARSPQARFRRAADAAAVLAELAGEDLRDDVTVITRDHHGDCMDVTIAEQRDATHLLDSVPEHASTPPTAAEPDGQIQLQGALPSLPSTWRDDRTVGESMEMIGVGLGLFELREIPLVGRDRHRDTLWEHLADTRYTARPHAVMLEGPRGVGKTRLAHWLAHRAHEVGAVQVAIARHSPIGGPADGIARMFADYLQCTGLPREQILQRVRNFYGSAGGVGGDELHQCVALTDLLAEAVDPQFDEQQRTIRFDQPQQRWIVWKRLLQRLAHRRPVLLVLDDVHWGAETLQFVRYLTDQQCDESLPVLMVSTLRADLIENNPLAAQLLEEIFQRPCSTRLPVDPLPDQQHRVLVENLLRLEPQLAEHVADRTNGNPLFAIQLVGDWIERGLLTAGAEGFRLADPRQRPPLPDDVQQLLVQRLEHITGQPVDADPGDALLSLQLAAVLGREVDEGEWRHLCRIAGVVPPDDLLESLAVQSLVRPGEQGWAFAHGALRETLLQIAGDTGRVQPHHRQCVQMLRERYDDSRGSLAARLARHLLAAGEDEEALEPLRDAVQYYGMVGDFEAAERFFEIHEEARRRLELDADDRRTALGWLEMIKVYQIQWKLEEVAGLLDDYEQACRRNNWDDLLAWANRCRAALTHRRADYEQAVELGERALRQFRAHNNDPGIISALFIIGWAQLRQSNFSETLQVFEQARERIDPDEHPNQYSGCLARLGLTMQNMGKFEQARRYHLEALEIADDVGNMGRIGYCHNNLGEIHRNNGELDKARHHYKKSVQLCKRIGLGASLPLFNLGMIRLEQRDHRDALPHLRKAREEAEQTNRNFLTPLTRAALAACCAGLRRWKRYDAHLNRALEALDESSLVERDLAIALTVSAREADGADELRRARRAAEPAAHQWRELGEPDRAADLQRIIDGAPPEPNGQ